VVDDNQDLVFGDYYGRAVLQRTSKMLRGKGTEPGRVTIQGFNTVQRLQCRPATNLRNTPSTWTINAGRLFLRGGWIGNWNNQYPASFNQTGDNPIDTDCRWTATVFSKGVKYTVSSAANLIFHAEYRHTILPFNIEDDPKTAHANRLSLPLAQAFDHLRPARGGGSRERKLCRIKTDGPPVAQFSFEGGTC